MISGIERLPKEAQRYIAVALMILTLEAAVWLTQEQIYLGTEIASSLTVATIVNSALAYYAKDRVPFLPSILVQVIIFFHLIYFFLFYIGQR